MQARLIDVRLIGKAWPLIEPWIASALEHGFADQTADDVRWHLERGSMQLWLAWDEERRVARGCWVTELIGGARGPHCNVVALGGVEFSEWAKLQDDLEKWAIAQGCNRLEMSGRAGWERKLARRGWKKIRTTLEKGLGNGIEQADTEDGNGAVEADTGRPHGHAAGAEAGLSAVPAEPASRSGATVY